MNRLLTLLILVLLYSCNKKASPTAIESIVPVQLYETYVMEDDPLINSQVGFSEIENFTLYESAYQTVLLGFANSESDIPHISKQVRKQNKNADNVEFVWSSKPMTNINTQKKAIALFAINLQKDSELYSLSKNISHVESYVDHENFEPCLLLHFNSKGEALLDSWINHKPNRPKIIAFVVKRRVRYFRKLRKGYHGKVAVFGFDSLEECKTVAASINAHL